MLPDARSPDRPAALLAREAVSLVRRLRLFTPARWAALTAAGLTRADLVHHLAQVLADATAAAEGTGRRSLPRLDLDLALADQLAVTADDAVRAGLDADQACRLTAHLVLHRQQLLADAVPVGLAQELGFADVLAVGRHDCPLPS